MASPRSIGKTIMSALDDYINGLEGKENLNPLEIARDIHGLATQEISTREAKIAELNGTVEAKVSDIQSRDAEIERWKAKNFDLAMQIPGAPAAETSRRSDGEKPSGDQIRIGDLFTQDVRNRHGI